MGKILQTMLVARRTPWVFMAAAAICAGLAAGLVFAMMAAAR